MEAELSKLAFRIVGTLLGVATEEVGYMWKCSDTVKLLKEEKQKLSKMKGRVKKYKARHKKEQLFVGVKNLGNKAENWVNKAGTLITDADNLLEEEGNAEKKCCDLSHLHYFGKKAIIIYSSLVEHNKEGDYIEKRLYTPQQKFSESHSQYEKNLVNTQMIAVRKVIEAIEDESKHIVGIYGPGGVGKTTIAVNVAATLEDQFDFIVLVRVTETVDVKKIQDEVEVAVNVTKEKEKVLIILDDVYEKLDLNEVGILCGDEHKCKILLTCRNIEVCQLMCAQSSVCVDFLQPQEAEILFSKVIGERLAGARRKEILQDLINECCGSPLIIQVVGNTLKDRTTDQWDAILGRLKELDTHSIPSNIKSAFKSLKQSYALLCIDHARIFILCSMFPKGSLIPLERLTQYLVALKMLKSIDTIKDARQCVLLAVTALKSSCFLSDGNDKSTTKMHDTIHYVAHLIASEFEDKILVEAGKDLKEWRPSEDKSRSYARISLMKNDIGELPDRDLPFEILDTLLIQDNHKLSEIPDRFLQSIRTTKVLDMEGNNISSLPLSLKFLTRLHYLNLGGNRSLKDIAILGYLLQLEILILNNTGITEVPKEIGKLVRLRLLEAKGCLNLSRIAPGVIQELEWLEELHIGFYVGNGSNESLLELNALRRRTFLDLFVMDSAFIPEGVDFIRINGFVIQIGGNAPISLSPWVLYDLHSTHNLIVRTLSFPFSKKIEKLLNVSHDISLKSVAKLNNVIPNYGSSNEFRSILLSECNTVTCLVDRRDHAMKKIFLSKLENLDLSQLNGLVVIWNCEDKYISLGNLTTLNIDNCPRLKRLFPPSVAKGLVNLAHLSIKNCMFKAVVEAEDKKTRGGETEQPEHFVLAGLKEISLHSLPNLQSFSSANSGITYPILEKVSISGCRSMCEWGTGVHETPKLKFVDDVPVNVIDLINYAAKNCCKSDRDGFKATETPSSINLNI